MLFKKKPFECAWNFIRSASRTRTRNFFLKMPSTYFCKESEKKFKWENV